MNEYFNNESLTKFIIRKKNIFLIVTILSLLFSIFFSGPKFITPLYKSSAILYPSNLYVLSDENKTEQMLQFLQSDDILHRLIKDFNLYKHYNIPTQKKHSKSLVLKKLRSNVSISKSQYEGVEIKVYDKNPEQAKTMIDSIISYYNQLVKSQHNDKNKEVMVSSKNQMKKIQNEIDSLKKKIISIRLNSKVLDAKKQARFLTPSNNELYSEFLKNKEKLIVLDSLLINLTRIYINEKNKFENAYKQYHKKIKYYILVSKPKVADKKSYPIRWLIVLLSLIGAYITTFIILSFFERNKHRQN